MDYAISTRGKKNRKVRAARVASGRARWSRLCKLGLKNLGTRLVYAGILPHSTFGSALHAPTKSDVRNVRVMMIGAGFNGLSTFSPETKNNVEFKYHKTLV